VGQLVALSYILHGVYSPAGAYFRGVGRPWLVTLVVGLAGGVIVVGSFLLIPRYGILGVGYAYLLGSMPALLGLLHCWFHLYGRSSLVGLLRSVFLPILLAGAAFGLEWLILSQLGPLNWLSLFIFGVGSVILTALLLFGADRVVGGDEAPSKQFLAKISKSRKVAVLLRLLPTRAG
jgi:O-antigen/teichoic acid export membrane protein